MKRKLLPLVLAVITLSGCTPFQRSVAEFVFGGDLPDYGSEEANVENYTWGWCVIADAVFAQVPRDHPVWLQFGALPPCATE